MQNFQSPSTLFRQLNKTSDGWKVGGVASGFFRDLDGDAIAPEAVQDAIAGFMAQRTNGKEGGAIRLHHDFWQPFLTRAVRSLPMSDEKQEKLIAAIALPLGRVTKMWVEPDGTTQWEGVFAKANPISEIIWKLLKEDAISLGVSLGGKIFSTRPGRDAIGQPCNVIDHIRLDELSITDNPAYRLTNGEADGASVLALTKAIMDTGTLETPKPLPGAATAFNNGDSQAKVGMSRPLDGTPTSLKPMTPQAQGKIQADGDQSPTGIGGTAKNTAPPKGKGNIPSDDWGITVSQFTRDLEKSCCEMKKKGDATPERLEHLKKGLMGLTELTPEPPVALVNFCRFLQQVGMAMAELPHMDDYQAGGTIAAIQGDLRKALEDFE
jgi:hypothetical protein